MPGKKQVEVEASLDPNADNVISIQGETWELDPITGLKSFFVVPKIIDIVSRVVYSALQADFDLRGLFGGEEGFDFLGSFKPENLLAIPYVMETLEKYKVVLSNEVLPALLSRTPVWLFSHGTPAELTAAIYKAFKWHAPSIFGEKPWGALKKLLAASAEEVAEEKTAEQTTDSEQSET